MNPQHTSNFLPDLVSRLDAASQEKQSGLWDTTKAFGSGLGQGLMNVGRGAMGIAETAAGGIGTLGAGIAAGGEALTDAAGITDPSFNTSWQAAKNMGEFTAGGAKNVGSVFGLRGADALMGREANPVTQSHERMMDEGGMSDRAKAWTRGGLGAGRAVAQAVPFIASGGTTAAGQLAAGGAYLGGEMLGTNPDRQLAAQRPGAQMDDWLPGSTMEFDESGQQVPPPAAPSPAAPLDDNYKGFEVDGWRPISGKDTFKMSADQNSSKLRELFIKALTRKDSSPGFLDKLVDRLRDVRDVGLVGAGGVSAGNAVNFSRKQLEYIKNYNPTVVGSPAEAAKRIAKTLQEGDIILQGDSPIRWGDKKPHGISRLDHNTSKVTDYIRSIFSGGMGGHDEHASLVTTPPDTQAVRQYRRSGYYGPGFPERPGPKLQPRAVWTGEVVKNPAARRWKSPPSLKLLWKGILSGIKGQNLRPVRAGVRNAGRHLQRYGKPGYGALSQQKLERALKKQNITARQHIERMLRTDVASNAYNFGPNRFSILRPKNAPSQSQIHDYLQRVGNTTFGSGNMTTSATLRRLLPQGITDFYESIAKRRGGRFQQGTNCAGGVCAALTGRGVYNIPSDLRHMKEFETVRDYVPETVLKRYGATAKNLEPLKKAMRRGSFRAAIPGLLLGATLTALGAQGVISRHQQKSASAAKFAYLASRLPTT